MLAFRVIATVFLSVSFITCAAKNIAVFQKKEQAKDALLWTLYGWLWRAFSVVSIWIV